jgi:hypothetical protein
MLLRIRWRSRWNDDGVMGVLYKLDTRMHKFKYRDILFIKTLPLHYSSSDFFVSGST